VEVLCGSGTYIRSLARDFGKAITFPNQLKRADCDDASSVSIVGACLSDLLRTESVGTHVHTHFLNSFAQV
jgi:hypothetical protein